MFTKILVAGAIVATAAYLLRDKIAQGLTLVEDRFLTWAAEDGTEDTPEPDLDEDRYRVGKRHEEAGA